MAKRNQGTRWGVLIFGISMAAVMVLSLMSGYLFQLAQRIDLARQQRIASQPTALPTFAPPVQTSLISFEDEALQASGLFSMAIPAPPEWGAVESSYDGFSNRARLILRNEANVVEASAESPETPITSMEELETLYNEQTLGSSWRSYTDWRETQRVPTTIADKDVLQLDFELDFRGQTFIARQASWFDDERVYSVRVITPENANELLVFLLDELVSSFDVLDRFAGTPLDWSAYYDDQSGHIVRYPRDWQVTDAAAGFPASVEAANASMRVEAVEGESIADADAAEAYVAGLPGVADVLGVTEVTRDDLSGYQVAYTFDSVSGAAGSGAVVLLNGEDRLHLANLRATGLDANLNEAAEDAVATNYSDILASFSTLSGVQYAEPSAGSTAPLQEQDNAQAQTQFSGGF